MKRIVLLSWILLSVGCAFAENHWQTHFSYNSVQQIAMDKDEVYALANGKMFSVNQKTERLTLFTNFSGLHGTEIVQLAYDDVSEQLLIFYSDGKLDILHNKKMKYVADLYNKQITSSKRCNNVTFKGNMAYLSMDFGILTFNIEEYKFVDTYYIAPEAQEVKVTDVMFSGDSIYAQTPEIVYVAHTEDNIVDFRYWKECRKLPQAFDTKKGKEYINKQGDIWRADGENGVACKYMSGIQMYYLPDGPCVNNPYHVEVVNGKLYMVAGGRWSTQENKPGHVMIYEDGKWTNITNKQIEQQTKKKALDFMDVAEDPKDPSRFFVTSYGTGLYEFRNNTLYTHYTPDNSILCSAVQKYPESYTRTSNAVFDRENRLWITVDAEVDTTLVCFLPNGTQRGLNFYANSTDRFVFHTSGNMVIDAINPQRKWLVSCRAISAVVQLNNGGTEFDSSDDQCKVRSEFYDQDGGVVVPENYYTLAQAPNGDIWVGSSIGPIIIPKTIDFQQSNQCVRLRVEMPDGTNFLDMERVNAFAWDNNENIWIGTQTGGVYVLNPEATQILEHYTCDNSVMPSNCVVALAYDDTYQRMFIGTGMGLVSYLQDPDIFSNTYVSNEEITYGTMYQWRSHAAFSQVDEVVVMGEKTYGLSANSLFSVNRTDRDMQYYTKLEGLNGSKIDHIAYNESLNSMLITYQNGLIDIMEADGTVHNISDLFLKQMSASKQVNDICMYRNKAILAMSFGVLVVDMKKFEISDTYYIGDNSSEINISHIAIAQDNIYAIAEKSLYFAKLTDNLSDYSFWNKMTLPVGNKQVYRMRTYRDTIYLLQDKKLYSLQNNKWVGLKSPILLRDICVTNNYLFALPEGKDGIYQILDNSSIVEHSTYGYNLAIQEDGNVLWLGTRDNGLVRMQVASNTEYPYDIQENYPDGPISNFAYRLKFFGDKLYVLPGGRWAAQYSRKGEIMIYENGEWKNIKHDALVKQVNGHKLYDFMNVAQDPQDPNHYFITTYGTGVLEMQDTTAINVFLPENSGLISAVPTNPQLYTRTDGAMYDDQGNLWILNTENNVADIHVIAPNGVWYSLNLQENTGSSIALNTPGEILVDNRNPQWKWIPLLRAGTGLILLQDNGTPTNPNDDHVTYHRDWIDQNTRSITPENIYAIAQDQSSTLWVGTSSGIFAIPASVDFANSNQCKRVVIPRNDGTGLGDYLLDNEQINAIAIDGANRLWVGTASSGIYLLNQVGSIDDGNYTVETIAHFTTENSILPTNEIISIAIQKSTGEVFIGTSGGLVSYMSDATQSEDSFDNLYVYPNPVHPNYQGYITFKGMMDDTEVRIVDASGNLVKIIQSTGGSAVWDATNASGQRVASGVYTALCNTKSGKGHGAVKVLIMN